MNENRILAAILTIAVSARASRASSVEVEVGEENWRGVIKHYQRILAELDRDLAKKEGQKKSWDCLGNKVRFHQGQ